MRTGPPVLTEDIATPRFRGFASWILGPKAGCKIEALGTNIVFKEVLPVLTSGLNCCIKESTDLLGCFGLLLDVLFDLDPIFTTTGRDLVGHSTVLDVDGPSEYLE